MANVTSISLSDEAKEIYDGIEKGKRSKFISKVIEDAELAQGYERHIEALSRRYKVMVTKLRQLGIRRCNTCSCPVRLSAIQQVLEDTCFDWCSEKGSTLRELE